MKTRPGSRANVASSSNSVGVSRTTRPSAVTRRLAEIDLQVAAGDALVGDGRRVGAAQDRAHAGDQLLGAERLDNVVVGAKLEAGDPIGLVTAGGQDHDRHARVAADRTDHVESVDARQAEVEDERVRTSRSR